MMICCKQVYSLFTVVAPEATNEGRFDAVVAEVLVQTLLAERHLVD
jgi:hypothetical protein